ncbi:type IV pilus biogenesis protein PilM [Paralysiella testudinis]|uniref:Type IV pilus assembly protein PilM n=1 Tax=Paralysiella testudinis TaxID=2809020 RepID=A0A892ZNE2_9NEIS|nr:type IV pilus assembly protein PilM [Paralysiella testudinis]QRQ83154.1 type IV pilus assembly protein PilM [Paralysiella testudinis]
MKIGKSNKFSNTNNKLKPSNHDCIGIHITPQAIHAVLVSARSVNQISLEKYAITPLPQNVISNNGIEDHDQAVTYLQQTMRQLNSNCKNITVSLPQNLASIQVVQYNPAQTELTLDEFVEFEVSQTADLESSSYDYCYLSDTRQGKLQDILLVSCKRDDVDARLDLFSAANITPKQMDVDILAALNAVNFWINQQQPVLAGQNLAIFQVGIHSTSALITQNDRLLYKQEINLGHEHLMQAIRRNYQLSEGDAWNMVYAAGKPADFATKVGAVFQDQLTQEIQRFLQFYYTTNSHDQSTDVQQILVSGYQNDAALAIAERITQQVNIPTQQITPIAAAQANKRLDNTQLLSDSSLLTEAFGLAVRGL